MAPVQETQATIINPQAEAGHDGVASVLAIGTANPPNCAYQADYPDYYFRVTNSEDKTMLKDKFKRICEKSMVKKRYFHLTEEILKENPSFCVYGAASLNARQNMKIAEMPKLGEQAALAAIKEWGHDKSSITHIVVNGTSGVHMPGADYQLVRSLGLRPSVKRVMLFHQGCFAGVTVLRIAKDLAENNPRARVLVVCSEITITTFRGPDEDDLANLVGQAIFGDGAAAAIVGAPDAALSHCERPLFRLVSASETILPDSEGAIEGFIREAGLTFKLSPRVPQLISENIEACLAEALTPFGISDWNSVFWVPHPGGAAILRGVEERAGLRKDKLRAAWHVLAEYGNMSSVCVFFIMDEMRKRSLKEGKATTGEGLRWGVMLGFGPGITVETIVMQSVPIN